LQIAVPVDSSQQKTVRAEGLFEKIVGVPGSTQVQSMAHADVADTLALPDIVAGRRR